MPDRTYKVPVKSIIYFDGRESKTEYIEVSLEEYKGYLNPLAKIIADRFIKDYRSKNKL